MEGTSDSKDPLVVQDMSEATQGNVNDATEVSDCHSSAEQLSLNPAGPSVEALVPEKEVVPEQQVPSSLSQETLAVTDSNKPNESEEKHDEEVCEDQNEPLESADDEIRNLRNTSPSRSRMQMSHSRGASQVSSCGASVGRMSGGDLCHSRGASTDGSTMDPYTYSATESRRGTYSEAGTLPVGSTFIEESASGREKNSEKKHSGSEVGYTSYKQKIVSSCSCCQVLLKSNYELPEHPTYAEFLRYAFTCPPHGKVGDILIWITAGLASWGCLISVVGEQALPGGNFFSLIVLYVMAVLAGEAIQFTGLPSLLGSLLVGIFFRSIPGLNVIGNNIDYQWSAALRSIALVIILIRAGLGLDPVALKKLSFTVIRLAFTPCLVETVSTAVASWFLLDLPWSWGFMLGFILSAVSPAVVVPSMLKLSDEGYGVEKGIPTLVIAAASIDDVLAISGFSVMLGLAFAKGSPGWTIAKGPIEIFIGIVYGVGFGIVCWYLPYREKKNRALYKVVILLALGSLALFGSEKVAFESAGAIGVLTLAFAAGLGWRKPGSEDPDVDEYYKRMWGVFMPLMFSLIGAEIDVAAIEPDTIGWGLLTLLICLTLRVITSFLVVMGGDFTFWERIFIAIAWLPKATVQAAIGSKALDYVRLENGSAIDITRGEQVVTIAVMVILVTAPLGAAAIKLTGPRLLARKNSVQRSSDDPETTV